MADDVCPLCGQPYANKLNRNAMREPTFRRDAKVCENPNITGGRGSTTYYVHL